MKISVIVPIYKNAKFFPDIVGKILANDYEDKEIIGVVDGEMTAEIRQAIAPLTGKVNVYSTGEHLGKAQMLNKFVKNITTDVILFLDNDILLPADTSFLSKLAKEMKAYDVVEMPKEVIVKSIYSAMISYEYLNFAITCSILSRITKRSPGVIGSAFAVKKELFDKLGGFRPVVHEDGDFGARAFRLQARYFYNAELKVKTDMPNTMAEWLKQRKRWALINVLWFKDNFLCLMMNVFKRPALIPAFFLIALPSIILFLLFFMLRKFNLALLLPFLYMNMQSYQFVSGILLWFSHAVMFSQGIVSVSLGLLVSIVIFFGSARLLKFRFNVFEYALYYFLYAPVLVVITVGMFILQLDNKKIELDWKIENENAADRN